MIEFNLSKTFFHKKLLTASDIAFAPAIVDLFIDSISGASSFILPNSLSAQCAASYPQVLTFVEAKNRCEEIPRGRKRQYSAVASALFLRKR